MDKYNVYQDIGKRTGGDLFLGVVGPVRTGKSTFINSYAGRNWAKTGNMPGETKGRQGIRLNKDVAL